jgi:hypothetical protein
MQSILKQISTPICVALWWRGKSSSFSPMSSRQWARFDFSSKHKTIVGILKRGYSQGRSGYQKKNGQSRPVVAHDGHVEEPRRRILHGNNASHYQHRLEAGVLLVG